MNESIESITYSHPIARCAVSPLERGRRSTSQLRSGQIHQGALPRNKSINCCNPSLLFYVTDFVDGSTGASCRSPKRWIRNCRRVETGTARWWIAAFVHFSFCRFFRQFISFLCSGCKKGELLVWDLQVDGPETDPRTLPGHLDWVWSVAFSPDDRFLASGDGNGKVMVWCTKVKPFSN